MNFTHIQADTVKRYLLGSLPDDEATAVEELYFTNRAVFKQIGGVEMELICDYLDGNLAPGERIQFENRYLRTPRLRKLVEDVRARRTIPVANPARPRLMPIALAAALAGLIVIGVVVFRARPRPVQQSSLEPRPAAINLFLEPGVSKGPGSQTRQFVIPPSLQPVSLTADLPGQSSPADYVARLLRIDPDGAQQNVFTSNPIRSTPNQGGQQITVTLPSSSFSPADYILELELRGGSVRETYVFRATAASK